jgi:plastocyanin
MYGSGNNNGGSGSPGTNEVWIRGMDFDPAVITIAAAPITWTNKDNAAHTVTSDDVLFDSGSIGENETYSFTFATPGSYPYHCALHSSMTAEVVVN